MHDTFYDITGNRHRLQLIEARPANMGLFQDMDARYPTRVYCQLAAVDIMPRASLAPTGG